MDTMIEIHQNSRGTLVKCKACGWSSTRDSRIIDAFDHTLRDHGFREHMETLTARNTAAHFVPGSVAR